MFLGIDIGTSEVKALLLDEGHRVVGSSAAALNISRPHPGHVEQSPHDWWAATVKVLGCLRQDHGREYATVRAIGLSGQMHGAVLLDANDHVLRPAILWNDSRAASQCAELLTAYPGWPDMAGSLPMPGFTAPKLRWVAQHEPALFARIAKVLLPKDYVRWMLTGEHATDMSDASGTLWLDVARRCWSDVLLECTGLTSRHMPRLVEGSDAAGSIRADVARELGLPQGTLVAGGAGDNAASAVGMGAVEPGQGFVSLGTSGVLFVVTAGYQANPQSGTHAFCHALPGRWHQMSVMLSAASALQWLKGVLGAPSEAALIATAAALSLEQRAAAPLFLPYLAGERTPHNDPDVRGSFHGLGFDTDAGALAYSVMEGVAFGLCDGLAALRAPGVFIPILSLVGGGSRSALWAQMLSSALDTLIVTHASGSLGGALGAARLAWLSAGADLDSVCRPPEPEAMFSPQARERDMLLPRYRRFQALYPREIR